MILRISQITVGLIAALILTGCASIEPHDYTNYHQHPPRSILILPPLNESMSVEGTYSYLSTTTYPVAELGYYVFPVAVMDRFFKENGMPTPGEMHQAPLDKIAEITGADAVLYITLHDYGSEYQVINSATIVTVSGQLVDTRTGLVLWQGKGTAQKGSGGSGNILADVVAAAITQVINSGTDAAHGLCRTANINLLYPKDRGLLRGPYHPEYLAAE